MGKGRTVTVTQLHDVMDFGHVIRVHADGTVSEPQGMWAPEVDADGTLSQHPDHAGWELLDGYSGQQGYSGPIMHSSEVIAGGLARGILAAPGFYVALVVEEDADDPSPEWVVAFRPAD